MNINKNGDCIKWFLPQIQNDTGWVAEGLLVSLFTGLALSILLLSWYPTTSIFTRWQNLGYGGIFLLAIIMMLITYWAVACYRRRRFCRGARDHLLMRNLMKACLNEDCDPIERLFSDANRPAIILFNTILLCKLQSILDSKVPRMQELRRRFRESGIKPVHGLDLERLFHTSKTYEQTQCPRELELVFRALIPYASHLHDHISRIKTCRRELFTIMSDYLDLFSVTATDIEQLKQTYRFHPPPEPLAREIVFANKVIRYLKEYQSEKLSPEQRMSMETIAFKRLETVKSALCDYRSAGKRLITAYDALGR